MTEQIHEIANSVLSVHSQDEPIQMITKLVEKILDNVPLHYVLEDQNMDAVSDKVAASVPEVRLVDKGSLDNIKMNSLEASILMEEFLDRVVQKAQENLDQELGKNEGD